MVLPVFKAEIEKVSYKGNPLPEEWTYFFDMMEWLCADNNKRLDVFMAKMEAELGTRCVGGVDSYPPPPREIPRREFNHHTHAHARARTHIRIYSLSLSLSPTISRALSLFITRALCGI
jgi:hypothetical protein